MEKISAADAPIDKPLKPILLGGGNNRASNLELLRIVSMTLVLLLHYISTVHIDTSLIHTSLIKSIGIIEINSISIVCVNCFILISGYFGIRWKTRSLLSLLYQVIFWLLTGVIIARIFNIEASGSWLIMTYHYFGSRWFVPAYLGLYILSPMLNAFIEKCNIKDLGTYTLVFYIYSTLVGYFCKSIEFNEGMSAISLIGIYMLGAFIRRSNFHILFFSAKIDICIFITLSLLLMSIRAIMLHFGISNSPIGYLNPIVIIMSVYLFLFFQKLNIGSIRFINFVATSAFAVYLFHMHPYLYGTYHTLCTHITSNAHTILYLPIFFFAIFLISIFIDRIRILSFNTIWNFVKR